MLGAVLFGHEQMRPVFDAIIGLAEGCAKEPWTLPEPAPELAAIAARVKDLAEAPLRAAYSETVKQARVEKIAAAKSAALDAIAEEGLDIALAGGPLKKLEKDIVRGAILETGQRIDGRDTKTVRPIDCQVGVLPRSHGSALFTRGETQALVVTTLGTGQDEQIIDALDGDV